MPLQKCEFKIITRSRLLEKLLLEDDRRRVGEVLTSVSRGREAVSVRTPFTHL